MPFCTDCGREIDEDYRYCPRCGRRVLKLVNVIDFAAVDAYVIIDVNGDVVSHVHGQHDGDFSTERCEKCGRELGRDAKYCSCARATILSRSSVLLRPFSSTQRRLKKGTGEALKYMADGLKSGKITLDEVYKKRKSVYEK